MSKKTIIIILIFLLHVHSASPSESEIEFLYNQITSNICNWIFEENPEADSNAPSIKELSEFDPHSFWWKGPGSIPPYSPSEFTNISVAQINSSKGLTINPNWAKSNPEKVKEYYDLHQETKLDRNLCFIATYFSEMIIHGDINQEKLATQLNNFDIRKLLREGPHENPTLSIRAQKLIYDSLHNTHQVLDIHLHNFGYDEGNYLNPKIAAQKNGLLEKLF